MVISGIILLLAPFLLVSLFSDKKKGFLYILLFSLIFHDTLAILTQFFSVFSYKVIFLVTLLANVGLLSFYFKKIKDSLFNFQRIDWTVLLIILIAFLSLYQIHYSYTGQINMVEDGVKQFHEVKNMEYVYPYFSDEWYSVALVSYSMESHSLPLVNILNNEPFPNLELIFHSFVSEITLILGLDPLTGYSILGLVFNILIIVVTYVFLRINNIPRLISGTASLSLLYITSSANIPGIWHFIPVTIGILCSLILFSFLSIDNFKMVLLSGIFVCLFYPPFLIFSLSALLIYGVIKFKDINRKILKRGIISLISLGALLILLMNVFPGFFLFKFIKYGFSRLFFDSFTGFNFLQLKPYYMMPWIVLLIAVPGLFAVFKQKKWLFFQVVFGGILWIYYSYSINRFVVDYERTVLYTSILVCLLSGFGLFKIKEYVENKFKEKGERYFRYFEIAIIIVIFLAIPFYSGRQEWKKLVFINSITGQIGYTRSPINNYLTRDDLEIFKDIKGKKFLSIPWKGLTIGVATKNYPAIAKEGIMSVGLNEMFNKFMKSNCKDKLLIAKKQKLDYIYLNKLNCSEFDKIKESSEGFVLYSIKR